MNFPFMAILVNNDQIGIIHVNNVCTLNTVKIINIPHQNKILNKDSFKQSQRIDFIAFTKFKLEIIFQYKNPLSINKLIDYNNLVLGPTSKAPSPLHQ